VDTLSIYVTSFKSLCSKLLIFTTCSVIINMDNSSLSSDESFARAAGVWILSFVICFPPLVGWKDKRKDLSSDNVSSPQPTRPPNSEPEVRNTTKLLRIPYVPKFGFR
jgi:hypothetical protein